MIVIPVLDLQRGRVVRAVKGDRQSYQPIVSRLCEGSDPVTVARALLAHTGSKVLYIADLDALTGGELQADALGHLLDELPRFTLWLDGGFADAQALTALAARWRGQPARMSRVRPVFASESLRSREALRECFEAHPDGLLSLDRRDGRRMDPAGVWDAPALWPRELIVMTLERVGADSGPDLDTLAAVQAQRPDARLVGAGGVRNADDLARAAAAGAAAWLVASALHDGRLPAAPAAAAEAVR